MAVMFRILGEILAATVDMSLPQNLSGRLLGQKDHYAPHPSYVGFEGWYTRIQAESAGLSIALIFCSLGDSTPAGTARKHYFHLSLTPIKDACPISEAIEFHLFPEDLQHIILSPPDVETGFQPFTLKIPDIGNFTVEPGSQYCNVLIPCPDSSRGHWSMSIRMTERIPLLRKYPLLSTPHGPALARLETLLPLHWGIFSTASKAYYEIKHIDLNGTELQAFEGTGVAHMEKNWGASFPKGWTWLQAFGPPSNCRASPSGEESEPRDCIAIAGGTVAFSQKAYLIHFRSLRPGAQIQHAKEENPPHPSPATNFKTESPETSDLQDIDINWTFRPLWTLILALPYPTGLPRISASWKNRVTDGPSSSNPLEGERIHSGLSTGSTLTMRTSILNIFTIFCSIPYAVIQFSPFGSISESYSYDGRAGVGRLELNAQTLNRRIQIESETTINAQKGPRWLALYCPRPGGHATFAYETFTARAKIRAYKRIWGFGWPRWTEIRNVELDRAALEFGGSYATA